MPFRSPLPPFRPVDDDLYELTEPLFYDGARDSFVVPAGYRTDLASVPRPVQWLVPRAGRYTPAAILHDWLTDQLPGGSLSSHDVDGIFRRTMRELGVPPLRRWVMWAGVRWGALLNPRRRAGWLRDAPAVLALTVLVSPLVLPAAVIVAVALLVDRLAQSAVSRLFPDPPGPPAR